MGENVILCPHVNVTGHGPNKGMVTTCVDAQNKSLQDRTVTLAETSIIIIK